MSVDSRPRLQGPWKAPGEASWGTERWGVGVTPTGRWRETACPWSPGWGGAQASRQPGTGEWGEGHGVQETSLKPVALVIQGQGSRVRLWGAEGSRVSHRLCSMGLMSSKILPGNSWSQSFRQLWE